MRLDVICFSKDRVFQLSEYLRTFHKHVFYRGKAINEWHPSHRSDGTAKRDEVRILMSIICKCSTSEMKRKYERLVMKYTTVNFMFEDESEQRSFSSHLLDIFDQKNATDGGLGSFVWFNVDDAFFFDRIDVDHFLPYFFCSQKTSKWHFAFHIKLSPNVWRSHMTNEHMLPLPHFEPFTARISNGGMSNAQNVVLTFNPAQGRVDWNYPWDLSGSVYTSSSVDFIVQGILEKHGRNGINHPNVLELHGNQYLKDSGKIETVQCGCLSRAAMHLLAVNQVQDVFKNPLYTMQLITKEGTSCTPSTSKDLEQYYEAGYIFNELYYKTDRFPSVHIGQVSLIADGPDPCPIKAQPLVSIVIPAYNAEHYVEEAMRSIMNQTYRNLEIFVIDDASTDSTRHIIENLMTEDNRIQYYRNSRNLGVAAALNIGFMKAKGAYIARMDADDISMSERIARQVLFLEKNLYIDILGTSIMTFGQSNMSSADGQSRHSADNTLARIIIHSLSPIITQWQMLFGCHFAHPTALMRRSVVDRIISKTGQKVIYNESMSCCEDYDLWLRCLYDHQFVMASLGDVLLLHRKHARNISKIQRSRQKDEAEDIIGKYLPRWIGVHVRREIIQMLRASTTGNEQNDSEIIQTSVGFDEAIQIIHKLGDYFLSICDAQFRTIPSEELQSALSYICQDVVAREGMLALQAFTTGDFTGAARMWISYCERNEREGRTAFCKLLDNTKKARQKDEGVHLSSYIYKSTDL